MRVELVRVGNSRGIRIPRTLIEQYGFGSEVELTIEEDRSTIAPERSARQGWNGAFSRAVAATESELILRDLPSNEFDDAEWNW